MAKDFSRTFYNSQVWRDTRNAYKKSVRGLCERCLARGIIKPAAIVHHKVYITADNVDDPTVTLNWKNLECLCRECHEDEHRGTDTRYTVDEYGRVRGK